MTNKQDPTYTRQRRSVREGNAVPLRKAPIPPSYQDHMEAPTYTAESGRAYSVYPASQGVSGGNSVSRSIPVPPTYWEHVGGNPAAQSNPVPPSYEEYIGERSVPRRSTVPPSYGGRVGGNPVQPSKPVPPSYEEYVGGADDGDRVPSAPIGAAVTQAEPSDSGVVRVEKRWKFWAKFVAGNLISAAVLISEIIQLDICFDGSVDDVDDDGISSAEREEEIASDASVTNGIMMFTLIFGLWVEVFSATTLSLIYRSPLDIKSVHKIPSDDMRSCGASVIIHFLAPFSWAMIYLFGGLASIYFSTNSSCGGQGGSGVEFYLAFSGIVMTFGGLLMIAVSTLILFFSCGSPTRLTDRCCATCRKKVNKLVLSNGPYLDTFWQLQGSVWSYRTGGFNLLAFILVGASGVLGEVLAASGSLAPDMVQELAGPLG